MKKITVDGNEACSQTAYMFTEVAGIYPITPSSFMAEHLDEWSSKNRLNIFNDKVKIVEMQSEAGAAGFMHGSLSMGLLTTTFTASQGLLLMIPNMYKMSGEMLPGVIHVAARSLSTHALSILGDHQDIYATRQTGFIMLASSSVQDTTYMAGIAHLSAIKASIPVLHFFDGFRTSHEMDKINILEQEDYKEMLDYEALNKFRSRSLNPLRPNTRGTAENDDIYFQATEARNKFYNEVPNVINNYMEKVNSKAGTNYKPFNYYGSSTAKYVIVAMGSVCETIKETIDYLNNSDYGLIEVHLYRPFSKEYLLKEIPLTVKQIAVLDRTKEFGSTGEPLFLDVKSVVNIPTYGGRYGLSSKNTTPRDIKAVFQMLEENPHHNFTIGIVDDVTNLSLETDPNFKINNSKEFLIYGFGSDGMVSASKSIMRLIGDNTDNYVQGYFQYDSKKSGGITVCHLRFNNKVIRSTYYVENPSLIVCTKEAYLDNIEMLNNIKENGTFILNTNKEEVVLPDSVKKIIVDRNISFYTINAYELAKKVGLGNKISTILETIIINLSKIIDFDLAKEKMKQIAKEKFSKKGEEIVNANYAAIDEAINTLKKVENIKSRSTNHVNNNSLFSMIESRNGNLLKTSDFINNADGIFEAGTSTKEKRMIGDIVPLWLKDNCISCNLCSFVCPHGVIRPYLIDNNEFNLLPDNIKERCIKPLDPNLNNYYFTIGISVKDCTGCGLCIKTCPGKRMIKALEKTTLIESLDNKEQEIFDYLDKNIIDKNINTDNYKNSQFTQPKFMFSGACAGCGETAYLKLLTQLFGKKLVISNATGCSSIYGASMPSTPYQIPWASSLFEDNAEYGYGMLIADKVMKDRIRAIMQNNMAGNEELFNKWLNNSSDYDITKEVYDKIDYEKAKDLLPLKDYLIAKSIWTIGGDGWAYDIGFGGLDHVVASNNDVNILILDTQVYSNTGGQSSKSSPKGSIASFTTSGKEDNRKDLARIILGYPQVYVATVCLGANPNQLVKAMKEAESYKGPSVIIAYAPCNSHGIMGGLENSIEIEKLAVNSGYFPIFRYNPTEAKFYLDSKNVNFDLYDEFLNRQTRYSMLKKINPEKADTLLKENKEAAIARFNYYQKLE